MDNEVSISAMDNLEFFLSEMYKLISRNFIVGIDFRILVNSIKSVKFQIIP